VRCVSALFSCYEKGEIMEKIFLPKILCKIKAIFLNVGKAQFTGWNNLELSGEATGNKG